MFPDKLSRNHNIFANKRYLRNKSRNVMFIGLYGGFIMSVKFDTFITLP